MSRFFCFFKRFIFSCFY